MAVALDTAGAVFGLWQGGNTTGLGVANEPGTLTWNEQFSRDFDGSQAFYQAVFGYDYQDMSGDGFKYAMLMVDGHEVGGIGEYPEGTPAEMPAAWSAYFAVTDTDAAVAKVTELGGRVVQPPRDSPYGRIGVVADNHGAVFSLITPARRLVRHGRRSHSLFMPNGPWCVLPSPRLRRPAGSRGCGRTRSSSAPRPGPWRARPRSR